MFCGKCGTQLPEGAPACPNCGEPAGAGLLPNEEPAFVSYDQPEEAETVETIAQPEIDYNEPIAMPDAPETSAEPIDVEYREMPVVQPVPVDPNAAPEAIAPEGSLSAKIWKKTTGTMDKLTLDKLRPVFAEDFANGVGVNKPVLAFVTDRDKKHEHELCNGSLGHIAKVGANDILYVYNAVAGETPLTFLPELTKNALYVIHPGKAGIYIEMTQFFAKFTREHVDELMRIGESLGARNCTITTEEELPDMYLSQTEIMPEPEGIGFGSIFKRNKDDEAGKPDPREVPRKTVDRAEASFAGQGGPVEPELFWFSKSESVRGMIMEGMKNHDRSLGAIHRMAETVSMTSALAASIDASAAEMGFKANFTLASQLEACKRTRLVVQLNS